MKIITTGDTGHCTDVSERQRYTESEQVFKYRTDDEAVGNSVDR